jgi:hAT family protein
VLHPKYKLKYFTKQDWEEDWVKTVEEIVREEFKRNYEEYLPRKPKTFETQSSTSKRKVCMISYLFFPIFSGVLQSRDDDSDNSSSSSSSSDEEEFADELDRYLSSGRIKKVEDPIKWWHENQDSYPRLSRMAKDYLTIPGE